MITKLPRWVWFGGAALTLIAGMINAVGFLGFQHQGVTHVTGTTTLLGAAVAHSNHTEALHLAAIIGFFFLGAIVGGFIIQHGELRLGRRYGLALLIESILLIVAVPLLNRQLALGAYLASCACGLQNGMVSTYSGAVLRTTHVTGIVTDLGIFIGQIIRGLPVDRRRISLGTLLIASFFAGGLAGSIAFDAFSYSALYLPAALTGIVGFAYGFYLHLQR